MGLYRREALSGFGGDINQTQNGTLKARNLHGSLAAT